MSPFKVPLISVIIPVFNAEKYLAEALQSIIDQNYDPMEIIVVDDGSTDGTAAVAADFGTKTQYVYQKNSGPAAARNKGLEISQGEIIGFIDADDWWSSDKLRLQIPHLIEDNDLGIILGLLQYVKLDGSNGEKGNYKNYKKPWVCDSFGAALIKRSVFETIGMLDLVMAHSEDTDWFLRARDFGISKKVIQEVVLYYRLHESNMTRNREKSNSYFIKALRRSIIRRR